MIITRRAWIDTGSDLFRHEARHTAQYAWCGGPLMLPFYFAAAGVSWLLSGDFGAWNPFERLAGLTDGGYRDRPLRWSRRVRPETVAAVTGKGRPAGARPGRGRDRGPGVPAGSTATPSR